MFQPLSNDNGSFFKMSDISAVSATTKLMVHCVDLMTDTNMQRRRNKCNITNARVICDMENNLKNETLSFA